MHPLDLLKIKFQVATTPPRGGLGRSIWYSLKDIKAQEGWRGLYRGVGPNMAGNASSWGLYFLLSVTCSHLARLVLHPFGPYDSYNMLKKRASRGEPLKKLSPATHLLCAAEASSHLSEDTESRRVLITLLAQVPQQLS
jgi:solute carrier family 25 folate transporter 32